MGTYLAGRPAGPHRAVAGFFQRCRIEKDRGHVVGVPTLDDVVVTRIKAIDQRTAHTAVSTPITVTVAGKAASSSAATPASLSLGKGPASGLATDAALRRLLLDDSAATGKPRPLFEP
ncbi:MAG: hypothetical protein ACLQNE_08340 [Thermoguttaceae bacterium]